MAAAGARMRLTVVVEALAEENAHGDHRLEALEAFKERKFAMPVQLEDSFETVWNDIEQRYKTNYLSAQQAATFSIKKLQDAYDCDLDMTDTVGAIFEGEPDRKMHLIKVVPHFIYRDTSVVPGSMLRPSGAQKRLGADLDEGTNKRRRIGSQQLLPTPAARAPSPNRPIPSTESPQHAVAGGGDAAESEAGREGVQTPARTHADDRPASARSKTAISLVELGRTDTGQPPFSSTALKQESPGPHQSPALNGIDPTSPQEPTESSRQPAAEEPEMAGDSEMAELVQAAVPEQPPSPQLDSQEAVIQQSPLSSADAEPAPAPTPPTAPAIRHRRDVYQLSSSPDFMHKKATPDKPAKTYGRSPRPAHVIQREVNLLNMARQLGRSTKSKETEQIQTPVAITKQARAFQRPKPDEIESTPQENAGSGTVEEVHATSNDIDDDADDNEEDLTASFLDEAAEDRSNRIETPARKNFVKPNRPGSLKKPSRASLTTTPTNTATTKHGSKFKPVVTPATGASASTSVAKSTTRTPSGVASTKGDKVLSKETTSRMEHLQRLLSASQNTPRRQGNTGSPARSRSIGSRDQSNRTSSEVRISVTKTKTPVNATTEATVAPPAVHSPTAQSTPIKSPVPLPSSVRGSPPLSSTTSQGAEKTPKAGNDDIYKKPTTYTRGSPIPLRSVEKATTATTTGTPRRSEVPLPPNVRHLRRSSSLQSSPLANDDAKKDKSSPSAPARTSAQPIKALPNADTNPNRTLVSQPAEPVSTIEAMEGAIVISSAESSLTDASTSEDEEQRPSSKHSMHGIAEGVVISAESQGCIQVADATKTLEETDASNDKADGEARQPEMRTELKRSNRTQIAPPQTQDKPPSGQGSNQVTPWGIETWGFRGLEQEKEPSNRLGQAQQPEHQVAPLTASISEDEGFAEQEIYSTAIEDNASRSRSASVAASIRSSPAVSRRPARFLSHSPTPDASESEDSDVASPAPSQAVSPQHNEKDESESESSSDSSDDEDVEMPALFAKSTNDLDANAAPPSSPPLNAATDSTPGVPATSQKLSSQNKRPVQRTPVPLPTQQSSQAPYSSQSVSVQAADRRRYTGFRSLREQLADTKAAQATTQTKTFDPRTMSLGKLAKGKPLVGFGGDDDETSDDESSSHSSVESD